MLFILINDKATKYSLRYFWQLHFTTVCSDKSIGNQKYSYWEIFSLSKSKRNEGNLCHNNSDLNKEFWLFLVYKWQLPTRNESKMRQIKSRQTENSLGLFKLRGSLVPIIIESIAMDEETPLLASINPHLIEAPRNRNLKSQFLGSTLALLVRLQKRYLFQMGVRNYYLWFTFTGGISICLERILCQGIPPRFRRCHLCQISHPNCHFRWPHLEKEHQLPTK